jgi:UDP-glucose 4-epimerase
MAAVCQVAESVADPAKYYRVNVRAVSRCSDAMRAAGVARHRLLLHRRRLR